VQIFCETHSDHIVNGTLVNIYEHSKDKKKGISHENVNISFFKRDYNVGNTEVVPILVNEIGRIQNHTEDFFDQYSIDIRKLIKK
jgi:predicted ATPase